jgi:hypothetical protein
MRRDLEEGEPAREALAIVTSFRRYDTGVEVTTFLREAM